MTNKELHSLLTIQRAMSKHRVHSLRHFPSRRQAKSTSHGDVRIMERRMRVIPGVRIEL